MAAGLVFCYDLLSSVCLVQSVETMVIELKGGVGGGVVFDCHE